MISHHHVEGSVHLVAERWGRGDIFRSPKETGSYVVWAVRGGPKLDQVQEEYHGRPREPSCFMKPSECNLDSYQVWPAIMGQGCVSKSSTTHLVKLLDTSASFINKCYRP